MYICRQRRVIGHSFISSGPQISHLILKNKNGTPKQASMDVPSEVNLAIHLQDLKSILLPSTAFGLLHGIALCLEKQNHPPSQILARTSLILLWVWTNLLPLDISNQILPTSIAEDALNKPWRNLPSQRLSRERARKWMLAFYMLAVITSSLLSTLPQCLSLILLGYWYNHLHGADANPFIRNLLSACGFGCFTSGAMQVAVGPTVPVLRSDGLWFVVIAAIIFSTVQAGDMYDQRGDATRGRRTVPLVIGDAAARWTIAVPVAGWSYVAPWFWNSAGTGYLGPMLLGAGVAVRTLWSRGEEADKRTFKVWNAWMVAIYSLPLLKTLEFGSGAGL